MSSLSTLVYSGRTTPRGNKIGTDKTSIYDNEQRKADNSKKADVGNGKGLADTAGKADDYSAPSVISTVDPFYTGVNNNQTESWNDDNVRTSLGRIDSGLGEAVYEAVKPLARTAKRVYDSVNNHFDVWDIVSLPYTMMTDGTRLDDDYYLTEEEKKARDSLGYKEFAGVGYGKGNEYMESLKGETEERKAQELTKTINNSNSDLMKYIGSFLVNAGAGVPEGINDIKNAFYSLTGEGQTAPKSALSIAADDTRDNLGEIDALMASGLRYAGSESIPMLAASLNPVLGKALYGINEAGRGYGNAIEQGAKPYEAFATGVGEGSIGLALEVGFGNIKGVSAVINPAKDKVADKALEAVKLVVKDDRVAEQLSNIAATAFMSMAGTELEVNAERYLRNVYLGEDNDISFTDPETLEEVAINLIIDEAFELADRGEIELKSGNDIENSWDKGYDEKDTIESNNILSISDTIVIDRKYLDSSGSIDWDKWAPNGGRVEGTIRANETLGVGTIIDRYGSNYGKYASPLGVTYEQRSLPYIEDEEVYHKYKIIKPIEGVTISEIAPAFGQSGGGTQYELPLDVNSLIELGYLMEVYNEY